MERVESAGDNASPKTAEQKRIEEGQAAIDRMLEIINGQDTLDNEPAVADLVRRRDTLGTDYLLSTLCRDARDPVLKAQLLQEYSRYAIKTENHDAHGFVYRAVQRLLRLDPEYRALILRKIPEWRIFMTADDPL